MIFQKRFKDFTLNDDVSMLVHVGYDYEEGEAKVHFVIWPEDIGTCDLEMTGPIDTMNHFYSKVDQETAQKIFDEGLMPSILEELGDE